MKNDSLLVSREVLGDLQTFLEEAFDGGLTGIVQEECGDQIQMVRGILAAPVVERQPSCPKCNDTGEADSGGVQPWGEGINIACDCRLAPPELAELQAQLDKAERLLRVLRSWQSQAGQEAIDEYFGES